MKISKIIRSYSNQDNTMKLDICMKWTTWIARSLNVVRFLTCRWRFRVLYGFQLYSHFVQITYWKERIIIPCLINFCYPKSVLMYMVYFLLITLNFTLAVEIKLIFSLLSPNLTSFYISFLYKVSWRYLH